MELEFFTRGEPGCTPALAAGGYANRSDPFRKTSQTAGGQERHQTIQVQQHRLGEGRISPDTSPPPLELLTVSIAD